MIGPHTTPPGSLFEARPVTYAEAADLLFSGNYDDLTAAEFRRRFPLREYDGGSDEEPVVDPSEDAGSRREGDAGRGRQDRPDRRSAAPPVGHHTTPGSIWRSEVEKRLRFSIDGLEESLPAMVDDTRSFTDPAMELSTLAEITVALIEYLEAHGV